jgi:hypothetical protein
MLVPHRDPAAIAAALRSVITRRDVMTRMAAAAAATAPHLPLAGHRGAVSRARRPVDRGEGGRMTAGSMTYPHATFTSRYSITSTAY